MTLIAGQNLAVQRATMPQGLIIRINFFVLGVVPPRAGCRSTAGLGTAKSRRTITRIKKAKAGIFEGDQICVILGDSIFKEAPASGSDHHLPWSTVSPKRFDWQRHYSFADRHGMRAGIEQYAAQHRRFCIAYEIA